jgi:hypothetical protein
MLQIVNPALIGGIAAAAVFLGILAFLTIGRLAGGGDPAARQRRPGQHQFARGRRFRPARPA